MMAYDKPYDKTNRWSLNKNQKDKPEDRDYKGEINIDGKEYWLSGYIKQGRNGAFISGTIKAKNGAPQSITQQALAKTFPPDRISSGLQKQSILPAEEMNDDIPF
jgi:hypothetical protein